MTIPIEKEKPFNLNFSGMISRRGNQVTIILRHNKGIESIPTTKKAAMKDLYSMLLSLWSRNSGRL